jgi:hypothetical protein
MLNFINNKLKNNKFKKIKDLNLKKIGLASFVWVFCATLFLSGSNFARGGTSSAPLPISFGGTGASTQAGALTNLGINGALNENSANNTFPSAKTVYDYMNKKINPGNISMDNINFSDSITSWTGGDLIYKGSGLSTTAANNKIKVGGKTCTTSGQGYTNSSAAGDSIPQVGCILPDLTAGTHAVTISTDGGTNYKIKGGAVVYTETPALPNCNTTSIQTFGANGTNCKAAMQQGQVIVLTDSRTEQYGPPSHQKYRVKKMPGGTIWTIDNLRHSDNDISNSANDTSYCSSTGLVWTHNPGSFTGCGYLYYGDGTYQKVLPTGWTLFDDNSNNPKSSSQLNLAMQKAAQDSSGNRNPVYSTTGYKNFVESDSGNPAPWLGVYSGYVRQYMYKGLPINRPFSSGELARYIYFHNPESDYASCFSINHTGFDNSSCYYTSDDIMSGDHFYYYYTIRVGI